jgi:hypothetical protein
MIDWYSVGFGVLWIFGLALVTASLSFAYYLADQQKRRFSQVLDMPVYQIWVNLGLVLFCLGWLGAVSALWERIAWGVLALIFVMQTWLAKKKSKVDL